MDRQEKLRKISEEIKNCKICQKESIGVAVVGEGSVDAKVMFIGEAPGKKEAETGRPFIGRSGKFLREQIRSIGLLEENVYITSPVKYLPKIGTPNSEQIAHGRVHLLKQIELIKPKTIVLLGRVAAEGTLERKVFVVKEHGKIIEEENGIKFFLTLHPAAVLRFQKYKLLFINDFKKLKELIKS